MTAQAFTDVLASSAPVPGGGGASALVGAIGTALASMVGNLTTGKKKYAAIAKIRTKNPEATRTKSRRSACPS